MSVAKPVLKWVGGKTQILESVLASFPKKFDNYFECFLGGGSVLIETLKLRKNGALEISGKLYASDINESLIGMYVNIRDRPRELIQELQSIANLGNGSDYFYERRSEFNSIDDKTLIRASALMIYLNKTCFRGLYREGPRGFNVQYGNYKAPFVPDEQNIMEVSRLVSDVVFSKRSWQSALTDAGPGDFVYMDPPYVPETLTSFVGYSANGFAEHQELFAKCIAADFKWVMSNSDTPLVRECFSEYRVVEIRCKRNINSKNPGATTTELIVSSRM